MFSRIKEYPQFQFVVSIYKLHPYIFRFSKQGRVPLYWDRFSPVTFVPNIKRNLSVLPQSWSISSNPLFVSCLQRYMFRFSKQGRVPLYSDRFSPVIFVNPIFRYLSVFPHSWSICSSPLFVKRVPYRSRFSKQGRVPLYSDKFSPVIWVYPISRDLSVFPQSCSICSSPLFVSCLVSEFVSLKLYFMFRFSKKGRVTLYSDRYSPVICVLDISRDLSVLPQSWSMCSSPFVCEMSTGIHVQVL